MIKSVNAVKWGHRLFQLVDHFRVEISEDPGPSGWMRARHLAYPPISGNGYSDEAAWDAWREDFAQNYDRALEGKLNHGLATAILGMVKAEVLEYEAIKSTKLEKNS